MADIKIRFLGSGGTVFFKEEAKRSGLKVGRVYTLSGLVIGDACAHVILEGVKGSFNIFLFDHVGGDGGEGL